jgi:hypothetical protein
MQAQMQEKADRVHAMADWPEQTQLERMMELCHPPVHAGLPPTAPAAGACCAGVAQLPIG